MASIRLVALKQIELSGASYSAGQSFVTDLRIARKLIESGDAVSYADFASMTQPVYETRVKTKVQKIDGNKRNNKAK
ncbi:hypothetical protein D6827_01215 [Candidatus Parcubacteria bacterium]|nr:MAG: hypothetical protein D6827_01215 [Candidatus Parcubacteria bacterium]